MGRTRSLLRSLAHGALHVSGGAGHVVLGSGLFGFLTVLPPDAVMCENFSFVAMAFCNTDGISAAGNGMVAMFLVGELWRCFVSSGNQLLQLLRSFMPCSLLLQPCTEMSGRGGPACAWQRSKIALDMQPV